MSRHEEMSSWMDGEADARQAESMPLHILQDSENRRRWDQWHLIGDVMRSASLGRKSQVAHRVAAQLASEPVLFSSNKARTSRRDIVRRSRLAYAAAVAAALGFVAMVALAPQMDEGGVAGMLAATGLGGKPQVLPSGTEQASALSMPEDPRLRELLEAHGSMSIRPVSIEVR